MKYTYLYIVFLLLIFSTVVANKIKWAHIVPADVSINPAMNLSLTAADADHIWLCRVSQHRLAWTSRSLGDVNIQRYDYQGNLIGTLNMYGNGAVTDAIAKDGGLYTRILFYDSFSVDGLVWMRFPNDTRQLINFIDSNLEVHVLGVLGDSLNAMTMNSDKHFVMLTSSGFGGDVRFHEYDTSLNLIRSKSLSDLGYASDISQKQNLDGYIISGGCLGQVNLDSIQYSNNLGYTVYILSIDSSLRGQWIQVSEDITCTQSHSWSDGHRSYLATDAFLVHDLDGIVTDGPNSIGEDFLLAAIEDTSFVWAQEVPSDTGWYGVQLANTTSAMGTDSLGNVYLIGNQRGRPVHWTDSIITGLDGNSRDVLICSYDSSGNLRWAESFGGKGYDLGMSLNVLGPDLVVISAVVTDSFEVENVVYPAEFGNTWLALIDARDSTLTINNSYASELRIYPQPSHGSFRLECNMGIFPSSMTLVNTLGQEVCNLTYLKINSQLYEITYPKITAGMYILQVQTDRGMLSLPVSVEN